MFNESLDMLATISLVSEDQGWSEGMSYNPLTIWNAMLVLDHVVVSAGVKLGKIDKQKASEWQKGLASLVYKATGLGADDFRCYIDAAYGKHGKA